MADPTEKAEAPETTPVGAWTVPNQDKFEQVIDARLKAHSESEKSGRKTSSRSSDKTS